MSEQDPKPPQSYYVYCVIAGGEHKSFGHIGIGGRGDEVHTISHKEISAVVSQTAAKNYERKDEDILAHQRVVQRVFQEHVGIPIPFSTILKDKDEVDKMLESRYVDFKERLGKLASFGISRQGEAGARDPASRLIEGALAQSFASALRIRQLNEEVSRLKLAGQLASSSVSSRLEEEIRALRTDLNALRSLDKSIAQTIKGVMAELRMPQIGEEERRGKIEEELRVLREEVKNLKLMQQDTKKLEDTVRSLLHEFPKVQKVTGTTQKSQAPERRSSEGMARKEESEGH